MGRGKEGGDCGCEAAFVGEGGGHGFVDGVFRHGDVGVKKESGGADLWGEEGC